MPAHAPPRPPPMAWPGMLMAGRSLVGHVQELQSELSFRQPIGEQSIPDPSREGGIVIREERHRSPPGVGDRCLDFSREWSSGR